MDMSVLHHFLDVAVRDTSNANEVHAKMVKFGSVIRAKGFDIKDIRVGSIAPEVKSHVAAFRPFEEFEKEIDGLRAEITRLNGVIVSRDREINRLKRSVESANSDRAERDRKREAKSSGKSTEEVSEDALYMRQHGGILGNTAKKRTILEVLLQHEDGLTDIELDQKMGDTDGFRRRRSDMEKDGLVHAAADNRFVNGTSRKAWCASVTLEEFDAMVEKVTRIAREMREETHRRSIAALVEAREAERAAFEAERIAQGKKVIRRGPRSSSVRWTPPMEDRVAELSIAGSTLSQIATAIEKEFHTGSLKTDAIKGVRTRLVASGKIPQGVIQTRRSRWS